MKCLRCNSTDVERLEDDSYYCWGCGWSELNDYES